MSSLIEWFPVMWNAPMKWIASLPLLSNVMLLAPKARIAVWFGSESSGKVRPSFAASSAESLRSSTEMATTDAPLAANSAVLLCSSPSCVRQ